MSVRLQWTETWNRELVKDWEDIGHSSLLADRTNTQFRPAMTECRSHHRQATDTEERFQQAGPHQAHCRTSRFGVAHSLTLMGIDTPQWWREQGGAVLMNRTQVLNIVSASSGIRACFRVRQRRLFQGKDDVEQRFN